MRFRWRRLLVGLVLLFISLQLWALIQLDPNSFNENSNDRSKRANEPRSTPKPAQEEAPDLEAQKAPEKLFKVDENLCEVTHNDAKSAIQRASDECKPKIHKCKLFYNYFFNHFFQRIATRKPVCFSPLASKEPVLTLNDRSPKLQRSQQRIPTLESAFAIFSSFTADHCGR
jgi:hypothetical protein